jgi:phosphoenolpyruvate synthase/pyruvate phosphate dikinase
MAGAGLFDSILNVKLDDPSEIKYAIIDVWLSLHTQRAVISRKQNKIKTEHA